MIGRKGIYIYICVVDSINIICKIIVKHFLLFITDLAIYKDRYHIGYMAGDLCPKIFFFSLFSKLLLIIFHNKAGNVYSNICSPDFADKL